MTVYGIALEHIKRWYLSAGLKCFVLSFCLSFIWLIFVSLSFSLRWPGFLSFLSFFFLPSSVCLFLFHFSFTLLFFSFFLLCWLFFHFFRYSIIIPYFCLCFFHFFFLFTLFFLFAFLAFHFSLFHLFSFLQLETESICTAWVDKGPSKNASQHRRMVQRSFGENLWLTLCQKQREQCLFYWLVVRPFTVLHGLWWIIWEHTGSLA